MTHRKSRTKIALQMRDFEFILGNSFHRLMLEVARSKRSRRKPASSTKELARFFLQAAVYRQTGMSAGAVKFPRPWSFNKVTSWLVHYADETAALMDKESIAPLLMEVTLAPYPLCREQGLFIEARPDLIARRRRDNTLGVYDYKTVSLRQYRLYERMLNEEDLVTVLHGNDQLMSYGAATENDIHEVNEQVAEIGLVVVPRTPPARGRDMPPVLMLVAPFDSARIKDWHSRRLERVLTSKSD